MSQIPKIFPPGEGVRKKKKRKKSKKKSSKHVHFKLDDDDNDENNENDGSTDLPRNPSFSKHYRSDTEFVNDFLARHEKHKRKKSEKE